MRRWTLITLIALGCSSPTTSEDASLDASSCSAETCDDGLYCNGAERCEATGCVAGAPPCGEGDCDEAEDRCRTLCSGVSDFDGDGDPSPTCGGSDCADDDATRASTRTEICDTAGVDEDCDPSTFGDRDDDRDGFIDQRCCNGDRCGDDCDDTNASAHRTATEACDLVDNDCDGLIDEGVPPGVYFRDLDGDGAGDPTLRVEACTPPRGFVLGDDDCNDLDARVSPTASEVCNGADDDCDTSIDEMLPGTGADCAVAGATGACALGVRVCDASGVGLRCVPRTAAAAETCNGLDDDCDTRVDEAIPAVGAACEAPGAIGACAMGRSRCFGAAGLMCLAGDPSPEACSAIDEDCDGDPINVGRPPGNFSCLGNQTRACNVCGNAGTEGCTSCRWLEVCDVPGRGGTTAWAGDDARFGNDLRCTYVTPPTGSRCCDASWEGAVGRYCVRGGGVVLGPANYEVRLFGTAAHEMVIEVADVTNGAIRAMRRIPNTTTGWSERLAFTHPVGTCATYEFRMRPETYTRTDEFTILNGIELVRVSDYRLR